MAYSIEARVPFLADPVVESAKGLAADHKRVKERGKTLLRDWFRELGPQGASARPKTGFNMPIRAWFEGSARGYLLEHLHVGKRLLDAKAIPESPRQRYTMAVLGAWNECLGRRANTRIQGASPMVTLAGGAA
jgi:asparagine synthetase B (glutamine-hydrolysing)